MVLYESSPRAFTSLHAVRMSRYPKCPCGTRVKSAPGQASLQFLDIFRSNDAIVFSCVEHHLSRLGEGGECSGETSGKCSSIIASSIPTRLSSRRVADPAGECQMACPTSTIGAISVAQ
jgi:hypothetical protein